MKKIPIEQFGRDHWNTFAYIETVCVDQGGVPDKNRMRVNDKLHPGLAGQYQMRDGVHWKPEYSTRLKGHAEHDKRQQRGHDDWHCADDLEAAGLIKQEGTGLNPTFRMTEAGIQLISQLRRHKAAGGTWSTFDYTMPVPTFKAQHGAGIKAALRVRGGKLEKHYQ